MYRADRRGRMDFNPRSPHGERHGHALVGSANDAISIHAPRTGSDMRGIFSSKSLTISIHAPRTGSDAVRRNLRGILRISIHAPRTGSDLPASGFFVGGAAFQSTLPARGATPGRSARGRGCQPFQSTLPARGATRKTAAKGGRRKYFNPRSPHGERLSCTLRLTRTRRFQSTLPARGATAERTFDARDHGFQSTLPARGATWADFYIICTKAISIHAPRTGSDKRDRARIRRQHHFNPRSPHGERRRQGAQGGTGDRISIHAPRTGSDTAPFTDAAGEEYFNPRSPHGERHFRHALQADQRHFNPRSPHGERPFRPMDSWQA